MTVSHGPGRCRPAALLAAAAVTAATAAAPAWASAELARQRNCVACHAEARKLIGPSWKDIAGRYAAANREATVALLAGTITGGGSGSWGAVPMPANPRVSPEEARRLAEWILATPR